VARTLSVDSSFLIDLERERRRGQGGVAHRFLEREPDMGLCLAAPVLGELADAYGDGGHPVLWAIRKSHRVLPIDEGVALAYGTLARALRDSGSAIGPTDLWIAATSFHHRLPLLTSRIARFAPVRGLELIAYR
jgi:predicted nucleic acid-binding protein